MSARSVAASSGVAAVGLAAAGALGPLEAAAPVASRRPGERGRRPGPAPETRLFPLSAFTLESGVVLEQVTIAYRTWGELAPSRDNAVVVCHALTGSADVDSWWGDLLGAGRALDPSRDFVVASNVLGSCYGTTGPASLRREGGERWGASFPAVTIRDLVRLQGELLAALGVERIRLVVGGSLGGMQALEWALLFPERVETVAALATNAAHSAWQVAWSEAQRLAIAADPRFRGGAYPVDDPPTGGLAAARAMAMVSYRARAGLEERFARRREADGRFAVARWLARHGERLVDRFDANCYLTLTRAMDTHDLARGRGALASVLGSVRAPVLVGTIPSDVLYPPDEQLALARLLRHGDLATIASPHGHDAFLIESSQVDAALRRFRVRTGTAGERPAVSRRRAASALRPLAGGRP